MNEKLKQDDNEKARLLEIYKIHAQLANDISNRRITTNRYYILAMSGMTLGLAVLLQLPEDGIAQQLVDKELLEWIMLIVGLTGILVCFAWGNTIDLYLHMNFRKYEVLKEMEADLDYDVFRKEYTHFFGFELIVPVVYFILFSSIFWFALMQLPDIRFHKFIPIPFILLILLFVFFLYRRVVSSIRAIKK